MRSERNKFSVGEEKQKEVPPEKAKPARILGLVLFALGVVIGLGILGGAVYADFEASLFDIPLNAYSRMQPLTCPIVIDTDEIGIVGAKVTNESPVMVQRMITGHFSSESGSALREETFQELYDAAETINNQWKITADDAEGGHLILVKVYLHSRLVVPAEEVDCGVLVFDFPGKITGMQALIFLMVISLATLTGGAGLWWASTYRSAGIPSAEAWGAISLVVVLVLGVLASQYGYFAVAVGLFYLSLLIVGVILPHFLFSRRKN